MSNDKLKDMLVADLGGKGEITEFLSEVVVTITSKELLDLANKLKSDKYDFDFLVNLTAVDFEENFTVVYNFRSLSNKTKLVLRVVISKEEPSLPSVIGIWKTADWQEREVFDLLGIIFTGHPELHRILLADDFEGYPLRKDYKFDSRR
ncbi:MAG: NADH-quinone oxidoreductase subunit C [Clostridia bacterium]|nr:NADH-quinone oxidoreductase subunit C [Clostridia bacterium]